MRRCTKCGIEKELSCFSVRRPCYKDGSLRLDSWCRECKRKLTRKWHVSHMAQGAEDRADLQNLRQQAVERHKQNYQEILKTRSSQ